MLQQYSPTLMHSEENSSKSLKKQFLAGAPLPIRVRGAIPCKSSGVSQLHGGLKRCVRIDVLEQPLDQNQLEFKYEGRRSAVMTVVFTHISQYM